MNQKYFDNKKNFKTNTTILSDDKSFEQTLSYMLVFIKNATLNQVTTLKSLLLAAFITKFRAKPGTLSKF